MVEEDEGVRAEEETAETAATGARRGDLQRNADDDDDEVVADVEWDDLEGEDTLIGTHSSM